MTVCVVAWLCGRVDVGGCVDVGAPLLSYTRRFQSIQDQEVVRALVQAWVIDEPINEHNMPRPGVFTAGTFKRPARSLDIDASTDGCLRIGHVYMTTGNHDTSHAVPLVHTLDTMAQLEVLAAASQSERSVLIEGETASRKSSLVAELARLAKRKLVTISMHESVETSDLIGQWLPVKAADLAPKLLGEAETVLSAGVKHLLLVVLPACSLRVNRWMRHTRELLSARTAPLKVVQGTPSAQDVAVASRLRKSLRVLERLLAEAELETGVQRLRGGVERCMALSKQTVKSSGQLKAWIRQVSSGQKTFDFVESPLVQAARAGDWVLLDNVSSAPPDVMERLNSLTEGTPTLNLYEHPNGTVRPSH